MQSPEGFIVEYASKLDLPTKKNKAEYEALIVKIGLSKALMVKNIKMCGESRLVVSQVNGEYEAKEKK